MAKNKNKNGINKIKIKIPSKIIIIFMILVTIGLYLKFNILYKKEKMGSAWFPRTYLKDIRQSVDGTYRSPIYMDNLMNAERKSTLETPVFAYFDKGNRFDDPREVDSLYASIDDSFNHPNELHRTFKDSNSQYYMNQHDMLINRGGNA